MKNLNIKSILLFLFVVILFYSCNVDNIISSHHHYKNDSKKDIKIYTYDKGILKDSVTIKQNETYIFHYGDEGITFYPLFNYYDTIEVVYDKERMMRFTYKDTINNRDLREKSSYYKIDIDQKRREYNYYYSFTEQDYQNATPINK